MPRESINRNPHRDDDDVRNPLGPDERSGVHPDTKSEARGKAREAIGNTARDTDTNPTGQRATTRRSTARPTINSTTISNAADQSVARVGWGRRRARRRAGWCQ
jgi:hypothetical protein